MVLSHSGEWTAPRAWIQSQGPEGRDAIQAALRELTVLGYRSIERVRDENGRVKSIVTWRHNPTV